MPRTLSSSEPRRHSPRPASRIDCEGIEPGCGRAHRAHRAYAPALLPLLLEHPVVNGLVVVGFGPRIVPGFGVDGELGVPADGLEGIDYFLRAFDFDGRVFRAVEDPSRQMLDLL